MASSRLVVSVSLPGKSSLRMIRSASPPTIASLPASMSCSTSSSMASRPARSPKPSTSSGVYVLPAPITAIFTPTREPV